MKDPNTVEIVPVESGVWLVESEARGRSSILINDKESALSLIQTLKNVFNIEGEN